MSKPYPCGAYIWTDRFGKYYAEIKKQPLIVSKVDAKQLAFEDCAENLQIKPLQNVPGGFSVRVNRFYRIIGKVVDDAPQMLFVGRKNKSSGFIEKLIRGDV